MHSIENCQVLKANINLSGRIYNHVYLFFDEVVPDLNQNVANYTLFYKSLYDCLCT